MVDWMFTWANDAISGNGAEIANFCITYNAFPRYIGVFAYLRVINARFCQHSTSIIDCAVFDKRKNRYPGEKSIGQSNYVFY